MRGVKNIVKEDADKIKGGFDLIVAIISRGYSDFVVDAARDSGASGATIIYGRGGMKTKETVLGINLEPEKEVVMIVVTKAQKTKVMAEIAKRTSLCEQGNGICFSMPINKIAGSKQLHMQSLQERKKTKN